jgi:hypothetical protein
MLFSSDVKIPRIRQGKKQALETLINEKALLLAKYLREDRANCKLYCTFWYIVWNNNIQLLS